MMQRDGKIFINRDDIIEFARIMEFDIPEKPEVKVRQTGEYGGVTEVTLENPDEIIICGSTLIRSSSTMASIST